MKLTKWRINSETFYLELEDISSHYEGLKMILHDYQTVNWTFMILTSEKH